jgi:membrane protein DedA with SNARE-associated domain
MPPCAGWPNDAIFASKRGRRGGTFLPHALLSHVLALLARYGYGILLPIAVVEGPAITIVAGAMVAAGELDGVVAFLLLVLADLVGDAAYYSLGRFGHAPFVERIGKWLALTPERLAPLEQRFRDNDWKLLMIGKTQALGSLILYFAGATRINFWRFMGLNLAATAPKVFAFELAGYFLGRSLLHSDQSINLVTGWFFGLALLVLLFYWLVRRSLWKRVSDDSAA